LLKITPFGREMIVFLKFFGITKSEFQCILADNDLPIDEPSGSVKPDNDLPNYYQANPPTVPVTVSNAPTQSAVQPSQRRSLFAFEEIYCTWFCFSLFTDGFANWRIAKKLNYKRPFLKIALPSMFFLADQAMDVYYHQLPMDDVVALILFSSFFIIFLYGCFNTIQLRRMFARRYPQKNPVGQPVEESYTTSCLLTFFCPCCSTAQMGSTLDAIEFDNIV
jgi:hypothetical protein